MNRAEEVIWLLEQLSTNSDTGGGGKATTASKGASKASNGQNGTNGSTSSDNSDGEEENSSTNGDEKENDDKKDSTSHRHSFHYAYGVRCDCNDPHGRKCLLYCRTRINRK